MGISAVPLNNIIFLRVYTASANFKFRYKLSIFATVCMLFEKIWSDMYITSQLIAYVS